MEQMSIRWFKAKGLKCLHANLRFLDTSGCLDVWMGREVAKKRDGGPTLHDSFWSIFGSLIRW